MPRQPKDLHGTAWDEGMRGRLEMRMQNACETCAMVGKDDSQVGAGGAETFHHPEVGMWLGYTGHRTREPSTMCNFKSYDT